MNDDSADPASSANSAGAGYAGLAGPFLLPWTFPASVWPVPPVSPPVLAPCQRRNTETLGRKRQHQEFYPSANSWVPGELQLGIK